MTAAMTTAFVADTHETWCGVDEADRYLCADLGCRGRELTSVMGMTRIVNGSGKLPDIAVDSTHVRALTPGQAMELAEQLAEQSRVARGGDMTFPLDEGFVRDLRHFSEGEVLDMLAVLLTMARCDALGQRRPAHLATFHSVVQRLRKQERAQKRLASVAEDAKLAEAGNVSIGLVVAGFVLAAPIPFLIDIVAAAVTR